MKKEIFSTLMIGGMLLFSLTSYSQSLGTTSEESADYGWYKKSEAEGAYGASINGAIAKLKGKKPIKVKVAVIGYGMDINHPYIKNKIWVNKKEIPGNGIDDDKNGYIDDVNGWNFVGLPSGGSINDNSSEADREFFRLESKYLPLDPKQAGITQVGDDLYFQQVLRKSLIGKKYSTVYMLDVILENIKGFRDEFNKKNQTSGDFPVSQLLKEIPAPDVKTDSIGAISWMYAAMGAGFSSEMTINNLIESMPNLSLDEKLKYEKSRKTVIMDRKDVGDNLSDVNDRYKGNNDISMSGNNHHSTAIAGVIAGEDLGQGFSGITENIEIIPIKIYNSGKGEPYDKDIANAIKYAVDNGAKVIDLMTAKDMSANDKWVNDAIDYAKSKDVVIIAGVGNDFKNIDEKGSEIHPVKKYVNRKDISTLIKIGESDQEGFPSTTTNYGKKQTDLFAPGSKIITSVGGGSYSEIRGAMIASAVTTGVVAMIRSYFPTLKATDIKDILMGSVDNKNGVDIVLPHSQNMAGVGRQIEDFGKLSVSGGILNAEKIVNNAITRTSK